jgi:hypothetical protein
MIGVPARRGHPPLSALVIGDDFSAGRAEQWATVHLSILPPAFVKSFEDTCRGQSNHPLCHKVQVVQVRVSPEDKRIMAAAAARAGLGISAWLRALALKRRRGVRA